MHLCNLIVASQEESYRSSAKEMDVTDISPAPVTETLDTAKLRAGLVIRSSDPMSFTTDVMDIMHNVANINGAFSPSTITQASFLTTTVQVTAMQSSTVEMFGADGSSLSDASDITTFMISTSSAYIPVLSLQSSQQTAATDQPAEAIGNNAPTVSATSSTDLSQSTSLSAVAAVSPTIVKPSITANTNPTYAISPPPTHTSVTTPTLAITQDTPAATSPSNPHPAAKSSPIIPIVASIVPLVIIGVCVFLYLGWRRQRRLRKQIQNGLEEDAAWDAGQYPTTSTDSTSTIRPPRRHDFGRPINQSVRHNRTKQSGPSMRYKPYPGSLHVRKHPHDMMGQNARQTSASQLEDPFATPTSQTFPTTVHAFGDEFRASQIGLAITTPPDRNASSASVADTMRTVLHRASRQVSNPFGDPSTSSSRESIIQPNPEATEPIKPPSKFLIPSQTSKSEASVSSATAQPGNLTKSDTPPEDLARKWIEVLKMEAAQANEAAKEAARRAVELRKEDGAKSHANLDDHATERRGK